MTTNWPQGTQQGKRWLWAKNMSDEDMPAYGVGALWNYAGTPPLVEREEDGTPVFSVFKPNAAVERVQNPALLVVNGPVPIPAGKRGLVTQDWPTEALLDEAHASVSQGSYAGPIVGSWGIGRKPFGAFSSCGFTQPIPGQGWKTVWVSSARHRGGNGHASAAFLDGEYDDGQKMPLLESGVGYTQTWDVANLIRGVAIDGGYTRDGATYGQGMRVHSDGVYLFGCAGTVAIGGAAGAADRILLRMKAARFRGTSASDLSGGVSLTNGKYESLGDPGYVWRLEAETTYSDRVTNALTQDREITISAPFAMSGLLNLVRYDVIWLEAESNGLFTMTDFWMWFSPVAGYKVTTDADELQEEYPDDYGV